MISARFPFTARKVNDVRMDVIHPALADDVVKRPPQRGDTDFIDVQKLAGWVANAYTYRETVDDAPIGFFLRFIVQSGR
jgi:hypothetical protein